MEGLSKVVERIRLPVRIPVADYLLDHSVEGRPVLPAVEAMEILAASVRTVKPAFPVESLIDGRFDKFLPIRRDPEGVDALCDMAFHESGDITAKLLTKTTSKNVSITRIKEHAVIRFSPHQEKIDPLPLDLAAAVEGVVFPVPSSNIYKDLVPFGPTYHNINGILYLSEDGALAPVGTPATVGQGGQESLLGSPFPLDAAFHAACVWGQRYARFVPFPMGFKRRIIVDPVRSTDLYLCRILPVGIKSDALHFDIWIFDFNGCLREVVFDLVMKDISGGRMKPPPWMMAGTAEKPFERVPHGQGRISLIEIATVAPFAEQTLSERETKRFSGMGEKRKREYLAARLACKRLARKLSGYDVKTDPERICTVCPDLVRPCCPTTQAEDAYCCAASHDNRFAVAVASNKKIGVDIEKFSDRVLKGQPLFVRPREEKLVVQSSLGETASTLRIWSIKEAACKALDTNLADAWKRVEVTEIGKDESLVTIDDKGSFSAFHDTFDRHLLTIIEIW